MSPDEWLSIRIPDRSEAELHLLRARLIGGLLNKAKRGELHVRLPVGFVYDVAGRVALDPDSRSERGGAAPAACPAHWRPAEQGKAGRVARATAGRLRVRCRRTSGSRSGFQIGARRSCPCCVPGSLAAC